jgi:outer membrane receptor protein involved in Fe transport
MKKFIFAVIGLCLSAASFAQTDISGTVTDNTGEPIPGANIFLMGSTSGATSDFDGNYSFTTDLTGSQTLQASYLGFTTIDMKVELNNIALVVDFVLQEGGEQLDEVVLTGSSTFRSQKQAPLSISSVKMAEITKLSANSQADILRSVPGITAEGGGGETATNIFIRGLPSPGQFGYTPLQYDGIPLIGTFGLNSSAHDVYARPDIGFKGVEFVRGGAAILYGSGSTAGLINYTSKTGDANPGNIINVEWGSGGRIKTDFYSGGQLGGEDSNTYYALTGFIRKDDGPLDTGLTTRGYQLRANIKKKFENGSFTFSGHYINDRAQFYLPLPLQGGSREPIAGNDGEDVRQLLPGDLEATSFLHAGGSYQSPIEDGVYTKGGYLMADFKYNLTDRLKFKSKIRFAEYQHNFALYVGGNGGQPNPITLGEYVNNIAPDNTGFSATYQGGNSQLSANTLVVDNLEVDRLRPMSDYSGEASLTYRTDDNKHNFTLGTFMTRTEVEDVNWQYRALTAFNNDPQLVNLTYTDAGGNNVIYSQGGIYNRIGQTSNNFVDQSRTAFYLTDEMIFDRWRFDVGFRYESTKGSISKGIIASSQVYDNPELTDDLRNVQFNTGEFNRGDIEAEDLAVSVAALYELSESTNLYANFSRGFFFPQLRSVGLVNGERDTPYIPEKLAQAEVGAKFGTSKFSGSVAAYYTGLTDRINLIRGTATAGGAVIDISRSVFDARTVGVEATWDWKLVEALSLRGTATYQNHKITKNETTDLVTGVTTEGDNVDNEIGRQPNLLFTAGLHYDANNLDANFGLTYYGDKFTNNTNDIKLDPFAMGRLGAGYTFRGDEDTAQSLRLGFSVFNLFDTKGLTEGNPRTAAGTTDEAFFFGRPVLPRRFFLTATLNF